SGRGRRGREGRGADLRAGRNREKSKREGDRGRGRAPREAAGRGGEAGTVFSGTVKSSVGLGVLLSEGIGDTLRVSLTGPPEEEVRVGWQILKALGLRRRGPDFVSCPTCGRVSIDIVGIATEVERRLSDLPVPLRIAVMGCAVNGPGEAREADVGVAGGKGAGLIFVKGEVVGKVKEKDIVDEVVRRARRLAAGGRSGA
ncbi:MAG TPA: flavodoxin-dependent (E)-4-hydroxy-3-methylbut-2-enyl-diphosphate synthase, partial [Candidatus Deferrimicrobiaceae bacterium]